MNKELVRDGKLDREAAAEALRDFLTRIIHAGKLRAEGSLEDLRRRFGFQDLEDIFIKVVES